MTGFLAKQTEEGVSVTHHRVARRVEFKIDFPNTPSRESSESTEDEIEGNTSAVANTSKYESGLRSVFRLQIAVRPRLTYGAPDQPRISVVIRKNIWPQLAVRMARAAVRHSASVALRGSTSSEVGDT
jgi:hypothetical protein